MNVWHLRRASKCNINLGKWSSGSMNKAAFPLSKARTRFYRLGQAWTWRVVSFEAGSEVYRILVTFRTDKEQFQAMLGLVEARGDTKVIARLEFHGTHGGWHLHYAAGDLAKVPSGIRVGPWLKMHDCVRHETFGLSHDLEDDAKSKAMTIVADVFRLNDEEAML